MKHFLSVAACLLLAALPARGQTPDIQKAVEARLQQARQHKAAIAYLQKLQQKDGGFAADAHQSTSSLRATNAAVKALNHFGGEVPDKTACADFIKSCFDKESGGFADRPGGKPDVTLTAVGLMAVVEVKLPTEPFEAAVKYLGDNVKSFEDIRIAAAAFEALGKRPAQADAWLEQIAKLRNDDGTYGKGDGTARETGGAVAAVLRLGGKIERPGAVLKAMKDGQRADGGYGKDDSPASDLESTYRVMRSLHMLKAKPEDVGRLRAFLDACHNDDGGYGVAKSKPSSASGTYYVSSITSLAGREVMHGRDGVHRDSAATSATAGLPRPALAALRGRSGVEVTRVSSIYETAPVGGPPGQGPYLNAVAELRTELEPDALLRVLLDIETDLGRVRTETRRPAHSRSRPAALRRHGSRRCRG